MIAKIRSVYRYGRMLGLNQLEEKSGGGLYGGGGGQLAKR